MQKFSLLIGVLLSVTSSYANGNPRTHTGRANEDTSRADATIKNATVYFGYGAELTHESKIKVSAATRFIVINQLSTNVDINSLQISCPEDVALLSQRYQVFYPPVPEPEKNKEAERLQDSIALLQKEIGRVNNLIAIEQEVLTKTGTLIETTISASGNKTVTSAEVLKLVEYYNGKIEKAKTNIYQHQLTAKKANDEIAAIQKRIGLLTYISPVIPKPYGQIILQVLCNKAAEIPVSLSYYTRNAGWTPLYDIRVNSKTNQVKLVYKASLTQTTGIDWKKTKLTLSTGTPNFGVAAPVLSPWYLQLYVPELYRALQGRVSGVDARLNTIQSLQEVVIVSDDKEEDAYKVEKKKDLTGGVSTIDPSTLQQFTTLNEGQLNTNFEIDLPYDVESDGQLHSVTIKDEAIVSNLKNYAVPRMDKEAYLLAEVTDWQNLDLLPGDANIIMDDTYVGKSPIDPNTTADTLNLSLGRDKRLAVKRTLVKELSSIKTSGKDSRQTFTYEIIVKNNKTTAVNMLLKDQYPISTIKEVEVKLDDNGDAMVNEENGVLTWKVSLKPGESQKFRFGYTVKYPKDKRIVNLK